MSFDPQYLRTIADEWRRAEDGEQWAIDSLAARQARGEPIHLQEHLQMQADPPANPPRKLDPEAKFVAVKLAVMHGADCVAVARSKTFAKRIANALNRYTPNREGV